MGLGHGSQASGDGNRRALVVLATGDGDYSGADFVNCVTRNRGGVGDVSLGGDDHFAGFYSGTGGCWANGGVLGSHMADGANISGVGSKMASGVGGDDYLSGFSSNRTVWFGGDEGGWELGTFWADRSNVSGVGGQVSVRIRGNNYLSSFSRD